MLPQALNATPSGAGYWLFTTFGRVVAFVPLRAWPDLGAGGRSTLGRREVGAALLVGIDSLNIDDTSTGERPVHPFPKHGRTRFVD